jgi:hypothetical protein
MVATSVIALLFSPKTVPVEKWLLASDNATIKDLIPGEIFQEWGNQEAGGRRSHPSPISFKRWLLNK